jgi:hypothetical protein
MVGFSTGGLLSCRRVTHSMKKVASPAYGPPGCPTSIPSCEPERIARTLKTGPFRPLWFASSRAIDDAFYLIESLGHFVWRPAAISFLDFALTPASAA